MNAVPGGAVPEAAWSSAVEAAQTAWQGAAGGYRAKWIAALTAALPHMGVDTAGDPFDEHLRSLYPEVEAFAQQMRRELWSNRHKGDHAGWRSMTLRQAWSEISWHTGKLAGALKAEDFAQVRELAADVANGAMMLDDILLVSGVTDICRCGVAVREPSPGCAWHEQRAIARAQADTTEGQS